MTSSFDSTESSVLAQQIIESQGKLWLDGEAFTLDSKIPNGLTNSCFLLTTSTDHSKYVLRIENSSTQQLGIHRKFEYLAHQHATQARISPSIIFHGQFRNHQYTVREFISGEIKTELSTQDIEVLATTIAKLHSIQLPAQESVYLSIKDRADNLWRSIAKTPDLIEIEYAFTQLLNKNQNKESIGLCHFDLIKENIIFNNDSVCVIDWEYAAISDQYFDLATIFFSFNIRNAQLALFEEHYCHALDIPKLSKERLVLNQLSVQYLEILWIYANKQESSLPLEQQLDTILDGYRQQMLTI